ncbi:hypothetical protein WKI68_17095 [Streptomyces sp. MS1.HAVA.3]|uniref:Uncharacterized protein n=1 Tax=Streptomyces caledonius TaxID=3134107 RepID=A0ABU8U471_9ACTN
MFAGAPVLHGFGGEQIAIQHQKFDDIALSWNTPAPRGAAHWPGPTCAGATMRCPSRRRSRAKCCRTSRRWSGAATMRPESGNAAKRGTPGIRIP